MIHSTIERPLFISCYKHAEDWYWGGETMDDAINAGLDLWGGEDRPYGFWVAPGHKTTTAEASDGAEHPYTVEADKAEWIPIR